MHHIPSKMPNEEKNRIMHHLAPSESNTRAIIAVNKMSTKRMNHDDKRHHATVLTETCRII